MRYYETIYIVDPNLENLVLDKTMDEISKELGKTESKLINHRVWGKKRLAYQIEKQKYGTYVLLQFEEGNQEKMVDFSTWMKLNNSIIRHMTVLLDVKPELYVEESKKEELVANDGDTVVKEGAQKAKEKAQEIDSKPKETK
jgi:small subunit ribosomal protein S6